MNKTRRLIVSLITTVCIHTLFHTIAAASNIEKSSHVDASHVSQGGAGNSSVIKFEDIKTTADFNKWFMHSVHSLMNIFPDMSFLQAYKNVSRSVGRLFSKNKHVNPIVGAHVVNQPSLDHVANQNDATPLGQIGRKWLPEELDGLTDQQKRDFLSNPAHRPPAPSSPIKKTEGELSQVNSSAQPPMIKPAPPVGPSPLQQKLNLMSPEERHAFLNNPVNRPPAPPRQAQ